LIEEIYMELEQKVADEVAEAGFRQKPGPLRRAVFKSGRVPEISRRGKTNHSADRSKSNSSRKTMEIIYQRQWSYKSQAASS
jgi:hypothetical protein